MKPVDAYKLPKVKDFMTMKVFTFTPEQDLSEVLQVFNKQRISCAPVLKSKDSKEVVGFITEEDVMRELASGSFFHGPVPNIAPAMMREISTLAPEMDVFEAERFFREKGLRHAPVEKENGELVGLVSRRDIMLALEQVMNEIGAFTKQHKEPRNLSMMNEAKWRISI